MHENNGLFHSRIYIAPLQGNYSGFSSSEDHSFCRFNIFEFDHILYVFRLIRVMDLFCGVGFEPVNPGALNANN